MSTVALRGVSDLTLFAEEAQQIHNIAKALATTSFVPKTMQGRPDEITGAILAGREIGLDPMTALQSIDLIDGRPAIRANTQRGLAMAAGVQFQVESASDTRVVMRAKGPGQDSWTTVEWPLDRAKKMGLTSKQNWQKMPQAMLIARATSELCRLVAANVLLGMPYSSEELEDGVLDEAPVVDRPKTRTVRREPVHATVAEPPNEVPPEPIGYTAEDVPKRELTGPPRTEDDGSAALHKALMATFNDLDMKDRQVRLSYVSDVMGREVHSVNQLSHAEKLHVLDTLKAMKALKEHSGADDVWPVPVPVPES